LDPEERLFTAMSGGKPDRVPTFSLIMDPNVENQVLGSKPAGVLDFLNSDRGSRHVDRRADAINRLFNPAIFFFGYQGARANHAMGFDGLWSSYWRLKILNHKELGDVFGRLFDIVDDGYGNAYFMYRDGQIKSAEEWRAWPHPSIAQYASTSLRIYKLLRKIWNKRIAMIPVVAPGLWENSWQPMGFTRFIALMRKDPDFAREVIGYNANLLATTADAYASAGARVIGVGDDLAYKSGPMLSPGMLEDFYGEGYRRITEAAHRHGSKIFLHCCGNTNELVEKFVEWGFDGAHAFEPTAGNDLAEARRKVGDKLCLIGNIDITHILVDARKEEVEEAVRKAIEDSAGGGFILAPTHTHPSLNVQNVRWMIEAAKRFGA